jgi:large subunit ribosomal protein L23
VKDPRDVIIRPVVSEKSYAGSSVGVYTFEVHPSASKPEIRDAVQRIFNVQVVKVNTLNRPGKRRITRGTNRVGVRDGSKRAIVTLAPGQQIPLFEN